MNAPHVTERYGVKALPGAVVDVVLRREQQKIYRRFEALLPPQRAWRVLDLGVNGGATERGASFFENSYPWPGQITAGGLEAPGPFSAVFPEVTYVQLDRSGSLPFDAGAFDLVFCSAVIEHVGSRERQRDFLAEVVRVGRRAFLTTPNRWYPVELHTVTPLLHWLPPPVTRRIYRKLGFEFFAEEDNLNLLDRASLRELIPAGVTWAIHEHRFLGFPSNLLLVLEGEATRR